MKGLYRGKIIHRNNERGYGFIQSPQFQGNIFFHQKNILYRNVKLFDEVTFQISYSTQKRHVGKKVGVNLELVERGNLKNYDLRIGVVENWYGKSGYINYPTDGKRIFLSSTRILFSKKVKNGDLIIFHPVVSTSDSTQLFAFFAYPVIFEKELNFLQKQYETNSLPALRDYILRLSVEPKLELTPSEKVEIRLLTLGTIDDSPTYLSLCEIIKEYKRDYGSYPEYSILAKYVPKQFLIQLWESGIIESYDVSVISEYFIKTTADSKRHIISKITNMDKKYVLECYYKYLSQIEKLTKPGNDVKTFLDIVFRNENTKDKDLYKAFKEKYLLNYSSKEVLNLWLSGYIDEIHQKDIVENFDFSDERSVRLLVNKDKEKYKNLVSSFYEKYFDNLSKKETGFIEDYPTVITYLKIFENIHPEKNEVVKEFLIRKLSVEQRFVLWTLRVDFQYDFEEFVRNERGNIDPYFRLKYALRLIEEHDDKVEYVLDLVRIAEIDIKESAINFKWNDLIQPTPILNHRFVHSFLQDISKFNVKTGSNFDIYEIADSIYNSLEKYQVTHLRLWLYYFEFESRYYNYLGFSECFKELNREERIVFRNKANEREMDIVNDQELSEVLPCMKFQVLNEADNKKRFYAHAENIYFKNGSVVLRMESGQYSNEYPQEFSSTGLNRIPSHHELNKILLEIEIKGNNITKVDGFDFLFTKIHTAEIQRVLDVELNTEKPDKKSDSFSYVEDWELRKSILDYLNSSQVRDYRIVYVNEPKNFYRRLDSESGIDTFEKTGLFTIGAKDGLAIIWENIDLSEDRATYIFKSSIQDYYSQIEKISSSIVSFAQLRSALSTSNADDYLLIFRKNLGFIGSIRKQRGRNRPFSNWLEKLSRALSKSTPLLPTAKEIKQLSKWDGGGSNKIRRKVNKTPIFKESSRIIERKLSQVDLIDIEHPRMDTIEKNDQLKKNQNLLHYIKEINNLLYKIVKR